MSDAQSPRDPMRHHTHYRQDGGKPSPYAGDSRFTERTAAGVASGTRTVAFVLIGTAIILGWMFAKGLVHYITTTASHIAHGHEFDPEPWTLLNLTLSVVAFYTGALVIIAQRAQTRTDTANEEAAARHREELAQFHSDLVRQSADVTQELHAHACGGARAPR